METINNGKNLVDIELSANVSDNRRIDMNKVAEYYARIIDLRGDIMDVAERLLSLYVDNDKDYYETAIEERSDGLGKVVDELCSRILTQAAIQREKRQ